MSSSHVIPALSFCNSIKAGFENEIDNPPIIHGCVRPISKCDAYSIPLEKKDFVIEVEELKKEQVIEKFQKNEYKLFIWSCLHSVKGGTCLVISVMNDGKQIETIFMPMGAQITTGNFIFSDGKICEKNYETHYNGPDSYNISHIDPLPSKIHELPENCVILRMSGHYIVPHRV